MECIRLLHASDLHIARIANLKAPYEGFSIRNILQSLKYRSLTTSYDPSVLRAFSDFVSRHRLLDAVLLTGDIATTGDYDDLVEAFQFVDGRFSSAWFSHYPAFPNPSLSQTDVPVFVLPGNHDRLSKTEGLFEPGGTMFHRVFGDYWVGDVKAYPIIRKDSLAVAIIAADFSLRSSKDVHLAVLNKYAQGRVYEDVLQQLVLQTKSERENWTDDLIVLWAIHFPPSYRSISRSMKLLGESELIRAANECEVQAVLCGHTHKQLNYRRAKMHFQVLCAGTVSEHRPRERHHFQIITLNRNGMQLDSYEYDHAYADFRLA
jgi:3',5'-cyclic AMP phosphodiesterase CpdA